MARDGMPLAHHEPEGPTRTANHLLLQLQDGSTLSLPVHLPERVALCARFV